MFVGYVDRGHVSYMMDSVRLRRTLNTSVPCLSGIGLHYGVCVRCFVTGYSFS
jgi:hypothetical protein